jgi:putative hydrolase of the HAD superfamily
VTSIEAVGFDLADTLVHYAGLPLSWVHLYPDALSRVAAAISRQASGVDLVAGAEVLSRFNTRLHPREAEVTSDVVLGAVFAAWGLPPQSDFEGAKDAFYGFFRQTYAIYEDTLPALEYLAGIGLKIGVLTDVPYGMDRRFVLHDIAGIAGHVNALVSSTEVGFRKPHPAGFALLADTLDVELGRMAYVGNEPKDIEGANRAGMISILIDRDSAGGYFGQKHTITSLAGLAEIASGRH